MQLVLLVRRAERAGLVEREALAPLAPLGRRVTMARMELPDQAGQVARRVRVGLLVHKVMKVQLVQVVLPGRVGQVALLVEQVVQVAHNTSGMGNTVLVLPIQSTIA